jgi:hypothetical protein
LKKQVVSLLRVGQPREKHVSMLIFYLDKLFNTNSEYDACEH